MEFFVFLRKGIKEKLTLSLLLSPIKWQWLLLHCYYIVWKYFPCQFMKTIIHSNREIFAVVTKQKPILC